MDALHVRAHLELEHVRTLSAYYNDDAYRRRYVHERFTPERIARALRTTMGGIAATARLLGCAQATLRRYLDLYPALREIADEERELALDLSQHSLYLDAAAGDPDARKFLLLTLGRDRGFVLRREVTGVEGTPLKPAEQRNTVILVDGPKEQYLEKLRQMREMARAAQGASHDVRPVALPAHGNADNGNGLG